MSVYPIVETVHGKVQGKTNGGVAVFRGIPYGGKCDGERRWLPPQPAEKWEGLRDCTENGPIAIQIIQTTSKDTYGERYFTGDRYDDINVSERVQDENCLVLNVLSSNLNDEKLPVLVYIHGGGYNSGSGNLILGADVFAREQNIVLVSINHRLNVFGYLDLSSLDDKYIGLGNTGMLDLVLALEWVRDNISAFGGDPELVTVVGESGGAMKISTLLAMERAQGLFHQAIIESGSAPVGTRTPAATSDSTRILMEELGVKTISELQAVPARELYDASVKAMERGAGFDPVGDDIFVPSNPDNEYIAPEISKHIPLLIGASEDELGIYGEFPDITWEQLREALVNPMDLIQSGAISFSALLLKPICTEENVDAVITAARAGNRKNETPGHTFMKIVSSSNFLSNGAFHHAMAKAKQGGSNVYNYFITFDAPNLRGYGEGCSWHTADLPLQFRMVFVPECEYMSQMLAQTWGAFVRSGNPSIPDFEWPEFSPTDRQVVVIDEPWRVETDPTKEMREAWNIKGEGKNVR